MQQPFEFKTPKKGVVKLGTYTDHDPESAIDALNVLPFDRQGRLRANQRPGSAKLWASPIGAANVQHLGQTIIALDPSTVEADTSLVNEPFTYANGALSGVGGGAVWKTTVTSGAGFDGAVTTGGTTIASNEVAISQNVSVAARYLPTVVLGSAYVIRLRVKLSSLNPSPAVNAALIFRGAPDSSSVMKLRFDSSVSVPRVLSLTSGAASTVLASATVPAGVISSGTYFTLEVRINGDQFQGYVNDVKYVSATSSNLAGQSSIGFLFFTPNGVTANADQFEVYTGGSLTAYRQTNLVAVAGGSIYQGSIDQEATLVSGGAGQLVDTGIIQGDSSAGKYYFVDGLNIRKLNIATRVMETYAATAGTAPANTTLACLYRDRLVLAAPRDLPQNFFFSRVGTHTDWDYTQVDSAAAFAGNASVAGRIGEPIVSLIPFSDDVLLIGGDHNLWAVRGDPADGGSIDMVSDAIGILGPNAWTKSPDGTVYFVGTGGFFKVSPGGSTPVNISSEKWNDYFASINRASNYVRVVWDRDRQGAYIFVTPVNSAAGTHLWYDARTDGFWPQQFPDAHGPVSTLLYDGDGPNDRVVLLGGRSGYVMKIDPSVEGSDDGTAISSRLVMGPYKSSDVTEAILEWLDAILGEPQTGVSASAYNVTVSVLSGQTAEKAVNSPLYTRAKTFTAPRRQAKWINRTRGAYFFLKLSNSVLGKTWNYEKALAMFLTGGLIRRR